MTPHDDDESGEFEESEFEGLPSRERRGGRRSAAIAQRSERARQREQAAGERSTESAPASFDELPGESTIVAITRGQCEVELDGAEVDCVLPKALVEVEEIAVGDRVKLARRPDGTLFAARLLERTNRLSRPDPFLAHRERIIAANLDIAVVVTAIRKPPLSMGLVDRFLVALAHGGVPAAIAVNKVDLADGDPAADPELAQLAGYPERGTPVIPCSAKQGIGLDELRQTIRGRTAVFVGHSGVGKSSLLKAIAPEFDVRVGAVSDMNDKGRHTTTRSRIYRLEDSSTRIVDTPGIREFGLWKLEREELASYFEDLAALAPGCRFTDCTHTHEPGCAVLAAVESGALDTRRYTTYRRIFDSLGG
ncbi:MAG: ribosome small subunit-dependent GTPase A [Thermoanaerobaculia bacterium]